MIRLLKFLMRLIGLVFLAIALVAAISDGSKSIAQSGYVATPIGQIWFEVSPESLNTAQAAIQRHVLPFLWDPIVQTVLTWPVWSVALPLGLFLLWLGSRRRRRAAVL